MYLIITEPKKPMPKLLNIKCSYSEDFQGGHIELTPFSSKEVNFINHYCPEFGKLLSPHEWNLDNTYTLFVYYNWKAFEVAQYLCDKFFFETIVDGSN